MVRVVPDKIAELMVGAKGAFGPEPVIITELEALPKSWLIKALNSIDEFTVPLNPETVPVPEEFKAGKFVTLSESQLPPAFLY
jgi:hypothetical protein